MPQQAQKWNLNDLESAFPVECQWMLDDPALVYDFDGQQDGMTAEQPPLITVSTAGPCSTRGTPGSGHRLVEPNGALGKALTDLLKNSAGLTRYRDDGLAPLDNNVVERSLS